MHTGEDKPDDHPSFGGRIAFDALRREQAQWLVQATARPQIRDAPYRVVICHIPLRWKDEKQPAYDQGGYDAYSRRSRDAWHEALVAWKAQVIIADHMVSFWPWTETSDLENPTDLRTLPPCRKLTWMSATSPTSPASR